MELVLQGYMRQVKKHTIKGSHTGNAYGPIAKGAVSVFPVGKHKLTLGGAFDGHISVSIDDVKKILVDSAHEAPLEDLMASIAACLSMVSKRAEEEDGLLTSNEEALLQQQ